MAKVYEPRIRYELQVVLIEYNQADSAELAMLFALRHIFDKNLFGLC